MNALPHYGSFTAAEIERFDTLARAAFAKRDAKAGDFVAYALIDGTARTILRGSERECTDYVLRNPRGPNGGSTHVAYRPIGGDPFDADGEDDAGDEAEYLRALDRGLFA